MSIVVFTEHDNGIFKKSGLEALSYAQDLAGSSNGNVTAIVINGKGLDFSILGNHGANKVVSVNGAQLDTFSPEAYSKVISQIAKDENASNLVISNTYSGKSIAPRIAIQLGAGIISGVVSIPNSDMAVKKTAFSNKAVAFVKLSSEKKVFCLVPNSYEVKTFGITAAINEINIDIEPSSIHTKITETHKSSGKIALTEAEIVVSGGRGMKGPENWGMIEELADLLGAATACSKPVSDLDWRPHSEHVGQTGITIKPNLYIAIGISGAIQHLAGVSSSKVICVINKDPEAPFFKAADYGIVGDAFEVLPKLIEKAKQLKHS
jgi:electron transfer flavoprotein alpha subunit